MRKLAVLLLAVLLLAGMCACGFAEDTEVLSLPDSVLMTYYQDAVFAGDSQVAKFRNFVKKKQKEDPEYFAGVDFRAANSYKYRFASYEKIPSSELKYAHLVDGGKKVTLYALAKKLHPPKIFLLAGINDALTTDRKKESGLERAMRYVTGAAELVRSASPETELFIISQMPVTKSFVQGSNKAEACQERWDAINAETEAQGEALGYTYLDLATGLKGADGFLPKELCADGLVHLNDAGYEVFARELLDFAQAEYEAGRWMPGGNE